MVKTANDCTEHEAGVLDFTADSGIYGDATVKSALRAMQRGKCAYCEVEVHDNPGTIDHFRPSKAVQQAKGEEILRPGYFWLAYQWENLLLACIDCNQYQKRIYFPLANQEARARSFHDDLNYEEPLLIDPSAEPVSQYLRFRKELVEAIDGNARGTETISVFWLNDERRALVGNRRKRLQIVRALVDLIIANPASAEAAKAQPLIDEATGPDGEYRAMMAAEFGA
jgi:uncharacterized protein (TIGR02646 family)